MIRRIKPYLHDEEYEIDELDSNGDSIYSNNRNI